MCTFQTEGESNINGLYQTEDSFVKSNLCRRPFCPSLWLFSRGSELEIALQSATTLSNHHCIHKDGFHLKLCELHFILNGEKKVVFFPPIHFHCIVEKSPVSWYNQSVRCGALLSAFYLFNLVPRMNEKLLHKKHQVSFLSIHSHDQLKCAISKK